MRKINNHYVGSQSKELFPVMILNTAKDPSFSWNLLLLQFWWHQFLGPLASLSGCTICLTHLCLFFYWLLHVHVPTKLFILLCFLNLHSFQENHNCLHPSSIILDIYLSCLLYKAFSDKVILKLFVLLSKISNSSSSNLAT